MSSRVPILLLSLSIAGCAKGADDAVPAPDSASGVASATESNASDAGQAIDAAMARYVDAVKRGDAAAIAAAHTIDAIVVMPSGPAMKGKSALTKGFADMLTASSVVRLLSSNVERKVDGDLAVETGTFEVTMQPKTPGAERTDKGQYMVVWQRQPDGSWRILRAFNRSDAPPRS
jgi:uncharacterized protein (TIGR02246 family)